MSLLITDLETKNSMIETFPLVNQIYKKMDYKAFELAIDEMILNNNYKMVAGFIDNKIVAVSGYWIARMLYCGRYLQASNLVVDENFRGRGIGKKILNYLENKACNLGCDRMVLDSYTENKKSHSLYFNEDFYIRGFHFMKDLCHSQ
jgi:GNAT superfamily N-acetyltransferase